jgi:hypothetical protein
VNRPKICAASTWSPEAEILANITQIGAEPYSGIFVDLNNTIYLTARERNMVLVSRQGVFSSIRNISGGLSTPLISIASITGDVYVDNGGNARVDVWRPNMTTSIPVMNVRHYCYCLFLDRNNHIYCVATQVHEVVRKWLGDNRTVSMRVAGTGGAGSSAAELNWPQGLFVDDDFSLFVADTNNQRIQRFEFGELEAITLAGNGAPGTINLNGPTAVLLDAYGYLFIVEYYNHRVVASGPYGFRCIIGCTGTFGPALNQLLHPRGMSFDSYGNLYVTEQYNHRLTKFNIVSNSCSKFFLTDAEHPLYTSCFSTVLARSNNEPALCYNAQWTINGTTLYNNITLGPLPTSLFVDGINQIYVSTSTRSSILMRPLTSNTITRNITGNFTGSLSVFVSINGDIFIDNGLANKRVDRWIFNTSTIVPALSVNSSCYGLFMDPNQTLYCSLAEQHQVIKLFSDGPINQSMLAAGTGTSGSAMNMLNQPYGIYIDDSFNLYVADSENDRVQMFAFGQSNGITKVGNGSLNTINLNHPTSVTLDGDGNLFIVDSFNHRIVGSGPEGYRCVVGCSGMPGSLSSQLAFPRTLAFDSYGNMFVTDRNNHRVQQFVFQKTLCGKCL